MTASTLTRSQEGLLRIRVALWLEPEEQADTMSTAESHAGYRLTSFPRRNRKTFKNPAVAVQAELHCPAAEICWSTILGGQSWMTPRRAGVM
jgi:hypothetical protein